MNETTWKKVSAAECLKWRIDNPGKEACCDNGCGPMRIRFESTFGAFEVFDAGAWCTDEQPGSTEYTYFIPEVTEPRYIDPKYSEEQTPRMGH